MRCEAKLKPYETPVKTKNAEKTQRNRERKDKRERKKYFQFITIWYLTLQYYYFFKKVYLGLGFFRILCVVLILLHYYYSLLFIINFSLMNDLVFNIFLYISLHFSGSLSIPPPTSYHSRILDEWLWNLNSNCVLITMK